MTFNDLYLPPDLVLWEATVLAMCSFLIGVLGGFVGLALGNIRLPLLLFFGVPSLIAAGTNTFISSVSSITGAANHYKRGRVDFRLVAWVGLRTTPISFTIRCLLQPYRCHATVYEPQPKAL